MSKQLAHKAKNRSLRKARIRSKISGTAKRPRLNVFISNLHITAQLIDDQTSQTIIYVSTISQKSLSGTMTDKAKWVGEEIANQAKTKKISQIVFDRGGKLYHGRVAALAAAAREKGLKF